jgi:hypothetical protein
MKKIIYTTQNAGQVKMGKFVIQLNEHNDKNLQIDLSMCKFKENIEKTLNINEKTINELYDERAFIHITKLNYYLVPSIQNNVGWKLLFHITRKPVIIHNISSSDALDIHKSKGTKSYSFTNDRTLLSNIIKELEEGNFTMGKRN